MQITSTIKRRILGLLNKRGYELLKTTELDEKIDYFRKVLLEGKGRSLERKIDSIVFSKDRSMQLHAFLTSHSKMTMGGGTIYILYRASSERHKQSYEDLKALFQHKDFVFVEEFDFRKQLISLCENSTAQTVAFFVDDIIVTHPVDYNKILDIDHLSNVVSLGRGKEMDYSVVLKKKLILPEFKKGADGFEYFRWDYTTEYNDWTYPIGVGANFFDRNELVVMLKGVCFKAPNSLETNLQLYKPIFIHRFGVCLEKIACVAVHANLVQTEGVNPDLGTFNVEELLKKWEDGWMIDLDKFYGVGGDVAQLQAYEFVKR
jgi:hypothetical protein